MVKLVNLTQTLIQIVFPNINPDPRILQAKVHQLVQEMLDQRQGIGAVLFIKFGRIHVRTTKSSNPFVRFLC